MPAVLGRKKCRQSRVGRYAGNFGLEKKMSANSGQKKMPVISDRNKMLANSSRKKMSASLDRKKMPVFLGGKQLPEKRQLPVDLEDC